MRYGGRGGRAVTAEVMAAALAFRLRRLEAMRAAGEALFAQPLLHTDVHPGGQPDGVRSTRSVIYEADLHDLLSAYSRRRIRQARSSYRPPSPRVYQLDAARHLHQQLARLAYTA